MGYGILDLGLGNCFYSFIGGFYFSICSPVKQTELKPIQHDFHRLLRNFLIKFLTDEGDRILDPFAGSNTTGFVAERLHRNWLAWEINENYLLGSRYRFIAGNGE